MTFRWNVLFSLTTGAEDIFFAFYAQITLLLPDLHMQVTADALIAEGVNKDQIETIGCGGTPNMFGKNRLNRVVILEAVK